MSSRIDRLVAELVMGWMASPDNPWGLKASQGPWWKAVPQHGYAHYETQHATNAPPFSTDISAAMDCIDEVVGSACYYELNNGRGPEGTQSHGHWCKVALCTGTFEAFAATREMAICVCLLRAKGVPESEIQEALQ